MSEPIPHAVSWNLTQRCNLRCDHCYLDAEQRSGLEADALSREECLRVVDELAAVNPHLVLILTGGEPLLHADLEQIVARAARAGMTPVLGSNGTQITSERVRRLTAAGLCGWGVSLDSADPGAHDRVRGVEGAWQRAVRGLDVLRQLGQPFTLQPSIFSWNRHELRELAQLALSLGADAVNFYFLVCTGRGQDVTDLSAQGYEAALHEITALQREFDGRLMVNAKCAPHQKRVVLEGGSGSPFAAGYAGGCPAATNYFRIGPTGQVSPCPYIPARGASVRAQPLAEIWARDADMVTLRDRDALRGRCGACEYRGLCGGCRARALAASGDPLGEDPSCLYVPREGPEVPLGPQRTFGGEIRFELEWSAEARERLDRVPSFARAMVVARVEQAARDSGCGKVDAGLMKSVRKRGIARSV